MKIINYKLLNLVTIISLISVLISQIITLFYSTMVCEQVSGVIIPIVNLILYIILSIFMIRYMIKLINIFVSSKIMSVSRIEHNESNKEYSGISYPLKNSSNPYEAVIGCYIDDGTIKEVPLHGPALSTYIVNVDRSKTISKLRCIMNIIMSLMIISSLLSMFSNIIPIIINVGFLILSIVTINVVTNATHKENIKAYRKLPVIRTSSNIYYPSKEDNDDNRIVIPLTMTNIY